MYTGRPDYKELTDRNRRIKGCFEIQDRTVHKVYDIKYSKCVGNFFRPEVIDYLTAHNAFDKGGILPYRGSLMEQPNKIMEIFAIIDNYKAARMEEERKSIEAKTKARTRGGKRFKY